MIYLKLFWEFFKVGLFTFGGGYGAIPLIRDALLANPWMGVDDDMFSYILGVAESTPGPVMINTATFIGTKTGGALGALCATLGAVAPSFIIILLIARFLQGFLEKRGSKTVIDAVKPCVVAIIVACGVGLLWTGVFPSLKALFLTPASSFDAWKTLLVFVLVFAFRTGFRLWKKKTVPPILSIVVSALMGICVFGV